VTEVIEALVEEIRKAGAYNANAQVAPVCILWTDKEEQWRTALPQLLEALPELLVFGPYDGEQRTGPALWLRCAIAGVLTDFFIPDDRVPVIYMPGISRSDLRSIELTAEEVKPLAELQFRGAMLSQLNGKDLTINAFLTSGSGGLGLDVAQDNSTKKAMQAALTTLLATPVAQLEDRVLEASDFNQLLSGDYIRDLLLWMNAPKVEKERLDANEWRALAHLIKQELGLDIESDGELVAAERLCAAEGKWAQVWSRFCESPGQYPGLPELLERVPVPDLLANPASYPSLNARDESSLEKELTKLADDTANGTREKLLELEAIHGARRRTLWAKLDKAPWASVLSPLARVAELSTSSFGGLSPEELGQAYQQEGWKVDAAVVDAIKACRSNHQTKIVEAILATIYQPWLADLNERFQKHVQAKGYPGEGKVGEAAAEYLADGELVFFIDGLRLDVAHQLVGLMEAQGINPNMATHWSAVPSVTATAKAAVSPIHKFLVGEDEDKDFQPSVAGQGSLTHDRFKKLLGQEGWQYLEDDDLGDPTGNAWVACGDIDKEGHSSELKLPKRIPAILDGVVERIDDLLRHGWKRIRIVTDHGWLFVPGKMPKSHLPQQAAESRWGRCAQLKQGVELEGLTLGWHWNPKTPIHFPHGIHSFIAGRTYAHGGVSLQECCVPVITVVNDVKQKSSAKIADVGWRGLVCKVKAEGSGEGLQVDLRTKVADASTSLAKPQSLDDGAVRLMVSDDDNEGVSAVVVVFDKDGSVLAKQPTTVGGDD
jgi:hypothetical protein